MAKVTALPGADIINGFKGTIDFYLWNGLAVARRWPRSPGRKRAPAVEAQWSAWTEASRLWVKLSPAVQEAYKQMAAGTHMSGRDLSVKCYLTNFSIVRLEG